jgi:Flp pilus assembly protein TadD
MGSVTGDWQALARAEQLLDLHRTGEAELAFREVLAVDPESVPALLGLGRALNERESNEEAAEVVRRALALAPDDATGHHVLCDVLCDLGDGTGALHVAERGLQSAPDAFASHHQHAKALLALPVPRPQEARAAAERALRISPHDPDGHVMLGLCLEALGEHGPAAASFRSALALDPHHVLAQNNLAVVEVRRGRLGRAAGLLRQAAGQQPQERLLHHNLDVVLLSLGQRLAPYVIAACVLLGVQASVSESAWPRAAIGILLIVAVGLTLARFRSAFPRGFLRPTLVWRRSSWPGRAVIIALALLAGLALMFSFAPAAVVATTAGFFGDIWRAVGVVIVSGMVVGLMTGKRRD